MGFGEKQIADLTQTINKADCDLVVSGTPIDLSRLIKVDKRILHVRYKIEEIGSPDLKEVLHDILCGIINRTNPAEALNSFVDNTLNS